MDISGSAPQEYGKAILTSAYAGKFIGGKMFSWIPIYKEIAGKVLEYENNQPELIKIISDLKDKGIPTINITDTSSGEERSFTELDAFTFFANFNRNITDENRTDIMKHLKEIWQLEAELPNDFDAIPLVNNIKSRFFAGIDDRKEGDIALLWKLYKEAVTDKIQEDTFNKVLKIKQVNKNITMGLFWIRPEEYVNLDKVNAAFLKKYDINTDFKDYKSYIEILKLTKERIKKDFVNISYEAWQESQNKETSAEELGMQNKETSTSEMDTKLENLPLNIILYGPPGTGKTYALQNKYFDKFTTYKKVQTKEEFIKSEVAKLAWWECIALALLDYKSAKVPELTTHIVLKYKAQLSSSKGVNATCWAELQKRTPLDCKNVNVAKRSEPAIFWKNDDRTWRINKELSEDVLPEIHSLWEKIQKYEPGETDMRRYEFVTFHQSFSYEDFIEGIKPNLDNEGDSNELSYHIEEGVFLRLAKKAAAYPEEKWALFIDEINRGNISNIFGELITLIEDDKRAGKENELTVTLPYSKDEFSVPPNLYIIGTMNTADRSIEALDSALRRRFSFIEVAPQPKLLTDKNIEGINLLQLLKTINERLLLLVGKDNLIGHSYFMQLTDFHNLQGVFKNKIIPLLEEYFYNDRTKIGMVLGDAFVKSLSTENKVRFATGFENEELLDDTDTYVIKSALDASPDDFIRIYAK